MSVLTETYTLRNVGLTPTPFDELLLCVFHLLSISSNLFRILFIVYSARQLVAYHDAIDHD